MRKIVSKPVRQQYGEDLNMPLHQIIKTGSCDLATLEESYQLHNEILTKFNQHISSIKRKKIDICPIT